MGKSDGITDSAKFVVGIAGVSKRWRVAWLTSVLESDNAKIKVTTKICLCKAMIIGAES
jgi:hypothetical protein